MDPETLTVGRLARLSGVTVRTLHHYDAIGLVVAERSAAGYRLYGRPQVARLQEVLFFRALGFGLGEIEEIVGRPGYRRRDALLAQRALLARRVERLRSMIDRIESTVAAETRGATMTNEEMLEVFGDFDPTRYEDEARERWGDSEAYRESVRRTSAYTVDHWKELGAESAAITDAFVALMDAGVPAQAAKARAVAERHRRHISKWFYECSSEIHTGLGVMYVEDPRFTENIDAARPGLARYMSEAIAANAGG